MTTQAAIATRPRQALIDALNTIRTGMLGIEGAKRPMQPMTHLPDWDHNRLWFLTAKESALVRGLIPGARANFCVTDQKAGFDACLIGIQRHERDRQSLGANWSPVTAGWFEGGKTEPDLTLLRLDLIEAALWGRSAPVLKVGYEGLKASLGPNATPDIGVHQVLQF